jgi:hypothetical protein
MTCPLHAAHERLGKKLGACRSEHFTPHCLSPQSDEEHATVVVEFNGLAHESQIGFFLKPFVSGTDAAAEPRPGQRGYEAWALHILGAIVRAGDGDAASRSLPARGARHRGQARDAPARRAVRAGTRGEGRR